MNKRINRILKQSCWFPILIMIFWGIGLISFGQSRTHSAQPESQTSVLQVIVVDEKIADKVGYWKDLNVEEEFGYKVLNNNLYIHLYEKNSSVSILDLTGKPLFRNKKMFGRIGFQLRKGIYLLRVNQRNIKLII